MKVAVLGAAGGIGQPLALLLKQNPLISHLSLYDIVHTPGVAADLSHICTPAHVTGHMGPDQLQACLNGSQIVVIPAGVPRKPGEICRYLIIAFMYMFMLQALLSEVMAACTCSCPSEKLSGLPYSLADSTLVLL